MKIALLGYGKMGKTIERIAIERGHEIVLRKTSESSFDGLDIADVAIDFSIPDAAVSNISACLQTNIPIVSGTTGWLDHYEEMTKLCDENDGAFIYGSNFSLGVNIFFELNEYLGEDDVEIYRIQGFDGRNSSYTKARCAKRNGNYARQIDYRLFGLFELGFGKCEGR